MQSAERMAATEIEVHDKLFFRTVMQLFLQQHRFPGVDFGVRRPGRISHHH
jgi:hypothetical protein